MLGQLCPEALADDPELVVEFEVVVVVCAWTGMAAKRPTMAKTEIAATSMAPFLLATILVFITDSPPQAHDCRRYLANFQNVSLIVP